MEFIGSVSNAGYYRDCVPTVVISIPKSAAPGFPFKDNERVPVTLVVAGNSYQAGVRSGEKTPSIKISADLMDADGNPARLADVLLQSGYHLKQKIALEVENSVVTILPPSK